jgi:transcriptional regulator CtsR
MDPRRDDSAPAGSSDASGTLYRAAHDDSGSARETAAAAVPTTAARSPTSTIYKDSTETARLRQDVVFRVGARLSKIKREELETASPAVDGSVLRFTRTIEQYIKETRPDSTKEEVIELFRDSLSDTVNFVHRQVLKISALHIFLREVLFAYGAVEKPIGGGYIPSRLIKVLVQDKEEYEILGDVLREERAKNSRDSSIENVATLAFFTNEERSESRD